MAKELDESVYREIEPSRSRQEDGRESFYLITTNLGELFSPLKASKNSLKRASSVLIPSSLSPPGNFRSLLSRVEVDSIFFP